MAINFFLAYFLEEKSQDRTGEGLAKVCYLLFFNKKVLFENCKFILKKIVGMENRQFTEEIRYEMNNLSGYSYDINDESKIEKTYDGQRTPMCDEWNYALFSFLISTIASFTHKTRVYIGN
jgi:hypothetical protein